MDNKPKARRMRGGHAVVESLRKEGVRHLFCVPGESYTSVMDGLRDQSDIQVVVNRQEGGACLMAEGYAKVTRTPGVCIVTRGPGATNASIGVHTARYANTPLVLLVGQVPRGQRGMEVGQEIDYRDFFGHMAKWVVEINDPRRVPTVMARAFHLARSGRPGPVVVSLPRDMLDEEADIIPVEPYPTARPMPDAALIEELVNRIGQARRPAVIAGSNTLFADAREELVAFAEKFKVPVVTSHNNHHVFPNNHPHYVGHLGVGAEHGLELLRDADLLIAVGTRLNSNSTANFSIPAPGQPLVQIYPDEETIGQNTRPELGIVADVKLALSAALQHPAPAETDGRTAWIGEYRKVQEQFSTPFERPSAKTSMERVMADLKATLPPDTIHSADIGNHTRWVRRYLEFIEGDSFLNPTTGCMGTGLPAAIAAKLARPERTVVAHMGDGGFLMNSQEMITATQYGAHVIAIVYNNGAFGTIRMHQEMAFPGRDFGTNFQNPDFAAMAESYGFRGFKVTRDAEFLPALQQALDTVKSRSALIEVQTDLENLAPHTSLANLIAGRPGI